jgi:hypothetical protein
MRLVSDRESVARGEVSILAIVETLLAIALVFYLSAHFNTLRWLAVAMCVSPLLLLRTEESTRLAIVWFDRSWRDNIWVPRRFDDLQLLINRTAGPKRLLLAFALLLCYLPFGFIQGVISMFTPSVIRIAATIAVSLRHPLMALRAVPKNWFRVTLGTDINFPLEMVPDHPKYTLDFVMTEAAGIAFGLGAVVLFLINFGPALLYRWSLKATSIIYAPLVFVAHSTFNEGTDLRTKLGLIKRGDLSRIRVIYGVGVIAAFLVKLVLMMNLPGFVNWWNEHSVSRFLALYVAPAEIPKWQLAELANSVLAIGAMLFARRALLGYELQHPWPETPVRRLLGFVSGLRWILALYAILCTGYITMRAAQHWHWPALGERWLPW